jgi:hypothetical protein
MSEQPEFLKQYSKKEHTEERNEVAAQIREARAERHTEFVDSVEQEIEASNLSESAEKTIENYRLLGAEVSDLNNTGVEQVHDLTSYVEVKQRLSSGNAEIQIPAQFDKPKELLNAFYKEERERWAQSKGSPEEMKELFTEEHLASLPMDQYALLLKHFPNAMVTHVTRQGIRDHVGMWEHTKGEGQYADGFMKILQEGQLKSPLAVAAAENGKEAAISKAIRLDDAESQAEAEERLEQSLSGVFDGYADRAAVHVATEYVADRYYGSEKGNEVFIAFPSAHIAAEHSFAGNLADAEYGKRNDTWILKDNALDKGMNINAGVAFIPAEARVDPATGSRYALDDLKRPIENQELQDQMGSLLSRPEVIEWAKADYESNKTPQESVAELSEKFGVNNPRVAEAVVQKANDIGMLKIYLEEYPSDEVERRKKMISDDVLERTGMRFKEAENTVSSKEFWESYFAQHPEQRPTKLEYYKGNDPTAALLVWKEKHGLIDAGTESSYDVGGKVAVKTYESSDKDRFKSIAEKIIQERFSRREELSVAAAPQEVHEVKETDPNEAMANYLDALVDAWKKSGAGAHEKAYFDAMWGDADKAGLLNNPEFNDSFTKAMAGAPDYNVFR